MRHDFTLERRAILFGVVVLGCCRRRAGSLRLEGFFGARVLQQDLVILTRNRDLLQRRYRPGARHPTEDSRDPNRLRSVRTVSVPRKYWLFVGQRRAWFARQQSRSGVREPQFSAGAK